MSVESVQDARIRAGCFAGSSYYDLRYYGADFVVPTWWLGVFDSDSELQSTDIFHEPETTADGLFRWLTRIVGNGVAERLDRLVTESDRRPSPR
jgi:hypothetical protein